MIDVNAYLGHFAFRQLRHNTAAGLLNLMDSRHIGQAVVSSAAAITYRNPQRGNEEMAAEVKSGRGRLIPFGVINPFYAGWQDDLKACHEVFGMKGLRLYPKWHNYRLSDGFCIDLIEAAAERGMLISIPIRVEDRRQQSWLVNVPDVGLPEIAGVVKACPRARFIIVNGSGFTGSPLGKKDSGLPANYFIEISRLKALMGNEIGQLIANVGADRIVFGTGMPFTSPDPSFVKLEVLNLSEAIQQQIRRRNAATLLGLPPQ